MEKIKMSQRRIDKFCWKCSNFFTLINVDFSLCENRVLFYKSDGKYVFSNLPSDCIYELEQLMFEMDGKVKNVD
jgi:hypothetical protein